MSNAALYLRGSYLPRHAQAEAKGRFVHRFTGEHHPKWANHPRPCGSPYPVQFKDDADWLANTLFAVTTAGTLDDRVSHCQSTPTWPNGRGI